MSIRTPSVAHATCTNIATKESVSNSIELCFFTFFFFFQAEDGIRDVAVTGVQTCALPICPGPATPEARGPPSMDKLRIDNVILRFTPRMRHPVTALDRISLEVDENEFTEIGRASCRERV